MLMENSHQTGFEHVGPIVVTAEDFSQHMYFYNRLVEAIVENVTSANGNNKKNK